MSGKIFTIFLVVLFALSVAVLAKDFNTHRAVKVTAEVDAKFHEKLAGVPYIPAVVTENAGREELGRTWYDYATNNQMGRKIAHGYGTGADGIHAVFMKILPQGAERFVTYDYYDVGLALFFGNTSIDEVVGRSGWPHVVNGQNDEAIVIFHSNNFLGVHIYQDAAEAGYAFSEVWSWITANGASFAGLGRFGDNIVFTAQADNANWLGGDTVIVSTDYMATWTGYNAVPLDPLTTDSGAERYPTFNPTNPDEFSHVYVQDVSAVSLNGESRLATSPDLGASYTTLQIQDDDDVFAIGTNKTLYIIENFQQWNGMYTQDGVYHAVAGAVQAIRDTTTSTGDIDGFPILYWNSDNPDTLIELTDAEHSWPADITTQANLAAFRPGNGLGNAYPHLSEGPSGELICIWQQWEDDGAGGLVTQVGSGGAEIFMTNIYGALSLDGGTTWGTPFFIAGTDGESDVYPQITERSFYNAAGDSLYLDIMYMLDTDPGTSLFAGGNNPSECVWYYERFSISILGIEDFTTVVDKFSLSQNYPNPFNPATTIEYSLEKTADITLDVYNVTGQKVATLVKGRKTAGEYSVTLDGANLSSGIYFYTLRAGDVNITKKMVLMK